MNRVTMAVTVLFLSACANQVGNAEGLPEWKGGKQEEAKFYNLLNQFRSNLKLKPLKSDDRLYLAASKHSDWMMGYHLLTHSGPNIGGTSYTRVIAEGVDTEGVIGEIIAMGNSTARATFKQWLFSPPHLMAMISPEYDHVGVARSDCEYGNDCYWTTDFAQLDTTGESDREFTVEEVTRAAEMVLGPLGDQRTDISLEGTENGGAGMQSAPGATTPSEDNGGYQSPWQRLKKRFWNTP
ncbi:MAG: CAP domain-containing protein [Bdellovibrionales bacterium]|nr:CAP domain-containing protein [Bdellovibrionales bacterium]